MLYYVQLFKILSPKVWGNLVANLEMLHSCSGSRQKFRNARIFSWAIPTDVDIHFCWGCVFFLKYSFVTLDLVDSICVQQAFLTPIDRICLPIAVWQSAVSHTAYRLPFFQQKCPLLKRCLMNIVPIQKCPNGDVYYRSALFIYCSLTGRIWVFLFSCLLPGSVQWERVLSVHTEPVGIDE